MDSQLQKFAFYPIFLLIMIISSNFLAEIFPCRFQELLSSNNYMKHIFGYLTLVFFVSLNIDELKTSVQELFTNSLYLYLGFMVLTKTNRYVFLTILVLLSLLYINYLHQTLKNNKKDKSNETNTTSDKIFKFIENNVLNIKKLIIGLLVFGFVLYLGEKKYEYKSNFDFSTFLLGRPNCRNSSPDVNVLTALEYAMK